MCSSPYAEYKFPAATDYSFPQTAAGAAPAAAATPAPTAAVPGVSVCSPPPHGYFALRHPAYVSPPKPPLRASAGSSVSSLASDATLAEPVPQLQSHFSSLSTDTLVEDSGEGLKGDKLGPDPCDRPDNRPLDRGDRFFDKCADKGLEKPDKSLKVGRVPLSRNINSLSLAAIPQRPQHAFRSSLGTLTSASPSRSSFAKDDDKSQPTSANESSFSFNRKASLDAVREIVSVLPGVDQKHLHLQTGSQESFVSTIHAEQARRSSVAVPQETFRSQILRLSPTISYVSPLKVAELIANSTVSPETGLRNFLVLDIRPLADYVHSHINGAINICLPSTLLKRPNFDLRRCVNSLPAYEKVILQNYFYHNNKNAESNTTVSDPLLGRHGLPTIIIYDNTNTSANVFHMCKKFIDHSCFEAASDPPIVLMDGNYQALAESFQHVLASGNCETVDLQTLHIQTPDDPAFSYPSSLPALNSSKPVRPIQPRSISTSGIAFMSSPGTPNVSNFCLPANLPQVFFKIRHNEESFNLSSSPCAEDELSRLPVSDEQLQNVPSWLRSTATDKTRIRANFNKLEECEKIRLNTAFKLRLPQEFQTPGGGIELTPIINSGLDFGYKNRYKDIFLYEHSRVLLNDKTNEACSGVSFPRDSDCDYINASYINPLKQKSKTLGDAFAAHMDIQKRCKYIATQGPINTSVGDFWRCVINQRSLVVVSLSGHFENGVEKCYPFWEPGSYISGDLTIDVSLRGTDTVGEICMRVFDLSVDGVHQHSVVQLHLGCWADMSVDVDPKDVLTLMRLKNHILNSAPSLPTYPTMIHCSAGCGRTGVFIACDMLTNLEGTAEAIFGDGDDPVYDVVNGLRCQRISMVQTVRQYSLIYKVLVSSYDRTIGRALLQRDFTKAFIASLQAKKA